MGHSLSHPRRPSGGGLLAALSLVGVVLLGFASPAVAGEEVCGCTANDPASSVELAITASEPVHHSNIGAQQETPVVDLRGRDTVLVGDAPQLLEGVSLDAVPVLVALEDDAENPECGQAQPPAGSDLSVTGHVYLEETGPVVWTGPCQGTLTVVAPSAPVTADDGDDRLDRGVRISAAVLIGVAVVCLALVPITARRRDRRSAS